ncbi:scavenger receptor cysteine-rich type 1 protein M130-like, partial [Apteryx rowi]|uniref:scavenger receptor cysteine-rich type 1 protein M130-like n=1 Tax=Apteryx rowi TaxID=308060 RepID=UPI000E1C7736
DIGVTCSDAVELRLVNGGGPCAGRVEVKLRGQWGTVADHEWDVEDAEVVCQQLGCGSAKSAYDWTRFGKGSGPIHLTVVDCRGNESALWDCAIKGWGSYNGTHGQDVGVACQGFVQLAGGNGTCSGRVEVRQGRSWATLCEAHMDLNAAHVICKELGCGAALAVTGAARFGAGAGPIWDGGFECAGNESLLSACNRRLPHGQGCTHANDAGVVCSPYTGFRLANGSTECTGRVELEVRGTWGSLCDAGWDVPDAQVLCHHLRCGSAASVPRGGYFGTGSGPLWRDTFHCSGTESHLGECPATVLGIPACSPGRAAAVNCSGSGSAEPLRLVDGESRCDGRLEVDLHGAWGRVLEQQWDASGASVVCRQLQCGVAQKAYTAPIPGPGSSPVGLSGLRCMGTEARLAQCSPSEGSATKLPYYTSDSVEASSPGTAPDTPALPRHDPPDGYDDATAVLDPGEAAAPGPSDGGVSKVEELGAGSRPLLSPLEPPGDMIDAPASAPRDAGYDDVGVSSPSMLL